MRFGPMGWGLMGGGFRIVGMLSCLLAFVAIVILIGWGIAWVVRQATPRSAPPPEATGNALDIARRRLAAGEITPMQFDDIRRLLQG